MKKKNFFITIFIIILVVILAGLIYMFVKQDNNIGSTNLDTNIQYSSTDDLHINMNNWN